MEALRTVQSQAGAICSDSSVPLSFGNDRAAFAAAHDAVALYDRAHWGRLEVSDRDRLVFLHNQSTNQFQNLKPGQGCDTVFVTSTARTIDLVTAYVLDEAVQLLVSPNRRERLMSWLDRYIFFGDQVKLTDVTDQTAAFSLIGPQSEKLLREVGIAPAITQPYASHQPIQIAGQSARLAVGSGLAIAGYTLLVEASQAAEVWQVLHQAGAVPLGEKAWDQLRIEQGRPLPDRELTEDYNPLEAGLWQTISFNKGCYIGQETIARLDTYKGVKQHLWGIRLDGPVEAGTPIRLGEEKVGVLTSVAATETDTFGLGYVRTKAGGAGLAVQIGDRAGTLVDVPFVQRDRQEAILS